MKEIVAYGLFLDKSNKILSCYAGDTSIGLLAICPSKDGCEALKDYLALNEQEIIRKVKVVIENER